ncbi:hypothetical protein N0V90_003787 [Kalmusia sp. IMI 367209]|nr:hypothetical protein N0V90_003787 [Kalmusia sp. IMI 367209]
MAEFASAIVGLAAVGIGISKGLHRLIETFKDAPTEILALSDEANAFWTMLSKMEEVDELEEGTQEEREDAKNCIEGVIKNGKHIAQEVGQLINKVQKEGLEADGKTQINKLRWLRIAKKAKKLQESLRVQKTIVCNFIAVRTLRCSARHGLNVTRLEMKMDMVIQHQISLMKTQNELIQKTIDNQDRDDNISEPLGENDRQTISSNWSATTSSRTVTPSLSISMQRSLSTPLDTLIGDTLVSLSMKNGGSRMLDSSDFEHMTQLFGKSSSELVTDFVNVSNFTTIHKVLLGVQEDYKTVSDYLKNFEPASVLTSIIDTPDSTGRSALAWAVEYGWGHATRALLQHGSDPNQLVRSPGVMSPLLHLAIAMPVSANKDNGSLNVVKELLKAGANINAVDHENWTPLHVAASWNNYDVIRELLTFGGDMLKWDLVTSDNQSAMDLSLNSGVNDQVQSILKNLERARGHNYCAEGHKHNGEGSSESYESEEEQFFDPEEGWCCA